MIDQPLLHPLTINEILDKALRIYRTKFAVLFGIAAFALIPEGLLELVIINSFPGSDIQRLQSSLTSLFSNIATMALIVAISNVYLNRGFSIKSSYSQGLRRFWSVVGAGLLVGIAIGLPLVGLTFCLITVVPGGIVPMFILAVPFVVFLSTRWSLGSQAIILEDIGASRGLKRSWDLTQNFFWRVLGTSFAASLLSGLLTVLPYVLVDYTLGFTNLTFEAKATIELVIQQLALVIVIPFTVAVQVLIYYDLRIRKEGFDLMLRATDGLSSQSAF